MSFICERCKKVQPIRSKPNHIIISTRKKTYPVRKDSEENVIDRGGSGWEIVEEQKICDTCYNEVKK